MKAYEGKVWLCSNIFTHLGNKNDTIIALLNIHLVMLL